MLGKKYTFESKTTRIRRLLVSGVFLFVISFGVIASFIVYIPIYAKMQKGRTAGAFYQKSPDAIAVFTGDKGRISYALELLKKNPSSKLFISGVHAANSFKTLIEKQAGPITGGEVVNNVGMQVDLDYESKNTFENVRETVQFLKTNPEFNKVLIISSDYHIMRIKLIISHEITGQKPEIFFDSVTNTYSSWHDIKKLLKEAVKITRTFFLMKILREHVISEED
ncbi:MAG: YdcF family protein [Bdellovibrionales bacterium]|nr:YdcF family protein [Bdellovibrionales bacterium]